MRRFNTGCLIIFIPTLVFLIVFTGLYLLIRMNFSLSNDYEAFTFVGGKPSTIDILLIGFRDLQEVFYFILLTLLFTFIAASFIKNQMFKNGGKSRPILNSLVLTLLLALLYLLYKLLYSIGFDKEYFSIYWRDIKRETVTLFISYLLLSIPITIVGSKQIVKSLKF